MNPPYSKGQVERWVAAYGHTRFCFLLRFDPSTTWFNTLYTLYKLTVVYPASLREDVKEGQPFLDSFDLHPKGIS